MKRLLQKMNWLQVMQLVPEQIDTLLLPVGTLEAHGSACLGTDNIIPETIAEGIAERLNALIAPTVNYGVTKSLYRYRGGAGIKPANFKIYITDILNSFSGGGFKNFLIINGHGGNNSALKSVAYDLHVEKKVNIAVIHWWALCGEMTEEFFGHHGGHGGTDEAAMVQAVDPSLVDKDMYDPDQAYYFRPGADVYPVPGTILLYKEGEGYPQFDIDKSKEYSEKVIEQVGEFAESVVARWRKFGL